MLTGAACFVVASLPPNLEIPLKNNRPPIVTDGWPQHPASLVKLVSMTGCAFTGFAPNILVTVAVRDVIERLSVGAPERPEFFGTAFCLRAHTPGFSPFLVLIFRCPYFGLVEMATALAPPLRRRNTPRRKCQHIAIRRGCAIELISLLQAVGRNRPSAYHPK